MSSSDFSGHRPIKSFVLRQGRTTPAQKHALETLWPAYGLSEHAELDLASVFPKASSIILEIGFGNGESLAQMAAAAPDYNFLGVEVHKPGVGHLLQRIHQLGLQNVRVYCADAVEILKHRIPDHSLSGIQIFFPDPWHKKRHHKRRLINPEFVRLAARKLCSGGFLHAATDWEDYAKQMLEVLEDCELFVNAAGRQQYSDRPGLRPITKFENRGQKLGHAVWDLIFSKV